MKKISNRVLRTELSMAIKLMDEHNFGYAKTLIGQVLDRVMDYRLEQEKE